MICVGFTCFDYDLCLEVGWFDFCLVLCLLLAYGWCWVRFVVLLSLIYLLNYCCEFGYCGKVLVVFILYV